VLPVDERELLGQVPAPQLDLLIGVVEAVQPPLLHGGRDLLNIVALRPGK
jgi:hypothetical protein